MFTRRSSFNSKRSIAIAPTASDLQRLRSTVTYGGNPEHKKNRGDFGLTPPASPRRDKTLCDGVGIFKKAVALKLLREGVKRGLVSEQIRNVFPQNIWAVTAEGVPLEAQLENPEIGTYHGYPMPENDAFRDKVIKKWQEFS
ncbi:MAG: hypothetical protein EA381_13295 [Planctomycetaceae bacterium]|nr:MAG: hypothetical protein EA381_13295 [Planctomycetaceae bacterium]